MNDKKELYNEARERLCLLELLNVARQALEKGFEIEYLRKQIEACADIKTEDT